MKTVVTLLLSLIVFWANVSGGVLSTNTVHSITLESLVAYTGPIVKSHEFADVTIRDAKFIDLMIKSINEIRRFPNLGPGPHGEQIFLPGFLCSVKFANADGREVYRVNILEEWNIVFLNGPSLKPKEKPQPVYTKNLVPGLDPHSTSENGCYTGRPAENPTFCRIVYRKLLEESPEFIKMKKNENIRVTLSGEENVQQNAPAIQAPAFR